MAIARLNAKKQSRLEAYPIKHLLFLWDGHPARPLKSKIFDVCLRPLTYFLSFTKHPTKEI